MDKLNVLLHELGISKVKLAKFLGVSRQMIYNYLELDDINKWPKDKKVLLLNLLGVKSVEDIDTIKVNTDYIMKVETRLNNLFETTTKSEINDNNIIFQGLGKKQKDILRSIIDIAREQLLEDGDDSNGEAYHIYQYLYHYLQSIENSKELRYILAYIAKATGFVKPMEYVFNEEEQFVFESIMFSAMTLYNNSGSTSKSKIAESHRRFVNQIEQKMEEKMSRTMELNAIRIQALKELGYTEISEKNASEVLAKIVEIQSRSVIN